jgi:glyoxylate/hydroxypyruvate reductase A
MALLFKSEIDRADLWAEALGRCDPALEVRVWPEIGAPAEIDYALVWKPPRGLLRSLANLKLIFSLGAGVDHLTSDPELPPDVPVLRMVEPGLTAGMTEYVVMSVLMHHRRMVDYAGMQRDKVWEILPTPLAAERKVGVMGLGVLGADAATALTGLGFEVAGWSRTPKSIPGISGFHGAGQLEAFLARSEILVCLLPLTEGTRGILNARTLALLPRGAALINVGRGDLLAEDDLLRALDSGQVGAATLDVFAIEPLASAHPFWAHPRVVVTPHCASITVPDSGARAVIENIRRLETGEPLLHVADLGRGY